MASLQTVNNWVSQHPVSHQRWPRSDGKRWTQFTSKEDAKQHFLAAKNKVFLRLQMAQLSLKKVGSYQMASTGANSFLAIAR